VLDLNGKKHASTDGFWGYDFVTGNLHNFGGRINLHGDLALLAKNQFHQLKKMNPNIRGAGLFMEGITQNPVYYDLGFEMLLREGPRELDAWLEDYSERRYGLRSDPARRAWEILASTVYSKGTNDVENSSIIAARPALHVKKSGPNAGFAIPYDNRELLEALKLLACVPSKTEGYRFDLVDICRQILSNHGQTLYREVVASFLSKDLSLFLSRSKGFIDLLLDVDRLLGTREEFSLERWIVDARRWGTTEEEKAFYEWNASCLITLWGPEEDSNIFDYSWREWSGLIGQFYAGRWRMFFDMLEEKLRSGDGYDEGGLAQIHGRESWRANDFYDRLADWEVQWTRKTKTFKHQVENDTDVVSQLLKKYGRYILEAESATRCRAELRKEAT
jgi:alpha-N-acetylglucosaminidase